MGKEFLAEDFLLQTNQAKELYFDYVQHLPIVDYHNHLPPNQIATDHRFGTMTEIWLKGDHYKWRAMRTNGINENDITGDADDLTKFKAWASTVPYTMRNPLYHWTHMELKKPFGITELLNAESAEDIYQKCNEQLPGLSTQSLLKYFKVELACTSDDPVDSLEDHQYLQQHSIGTKVLPTFRPDKVMAVEHVRQYNEYIKKLSAAANIEINSYASLLEAVKQRHAFFHSVGCRLSDHGMETFYADDFTMSALEQSFNKITGGRNLDENEIRQFKSATLHFICEWNHEKNWVQQFHVGALRNNNSRLLKRLGADAGVDSMGDFLIAKDRCRNSLTAWTKKINSLNLLYIITTLPTMNCLQP